jgi:hypothetical protein
MAGKLAKVGGAITGIRPVFPVFGGDGHRVFRGCQARKSKDFKNNYVLFLFEVP